MTFPLKAMQWHRISTIGFRIAETRYADTMIVDAVHVAIDRQPLDQLIDGDGALLPLLEAFDTGGSIWEDRPPTTRTSFRNLLDDTVPVAECGCGEFGCGGAWATIAFADDRVGWLDLTDGSDRHGQFVFDRAQYEDAIAALVAERRARR